MLKISVTHFTGFSCYGSRHLCTRINNRHRKHTVLLHSRHCWHFMENIKVFSFSKFFCNSYTRSQVNSTDLLFILGEPLVAEDTCALSTDAQGHLMVHGHAHADGMAHYDNVWHTQSENLSRLKADGVVSILISHSILRLWYCRDFTYLWSLFDRVWGGIRSSVHCLILMRDCKKYEFKVIVFFFNHSQ